MLNKFTIRVKLFLVYSFLIFGAMSLVFILYYAYTSGELKQSAYNSLRQTATGISAQLETEMYNLDLITTKVIFSDTIKKSFFEQMSTSQSINNPTNLRVITDALYSIMGPLPLGWQINLIRDNGVFMSAGNYSFATAYPKHIIDETSWIDAVYKADGSRVISLPHYDNWINNGTTVISVARCFGRTFNSPKDSIVEVQQDYNAMSKLIKSLLFNSSSSYAQNVNLFIVDIDGNLVYPIEEAARKDSSFYWEKVKQKHQISGKYTIKNPDSGKYETLAYDYSDYTGWTTMAVLSENLLLKNVQEFWQVVFAVILLILLVTLFISFTVAKSLTIPIRNMFNSIQSLDLSNLLPDFNKHRQETSNELQMLYSAFQEMCARLKDSIEMTITMRSKEMEARMVALQAQMNPHLLYNTISTISILAEEQGQDKIVQICSCMNQMFQYILSSSKRNITLQDEINYAESYLSLVKVRYGQFLEYRMDVDPRLLEIGIPKLIIQPIVENCIKYGVNTPSSWKINITGVVEESTWLIRIKDSGPGFTQSVIEEWENISTVKDEGYGTKIGETHGLGLKNTYERLRFFYSEDVIFKIYNLTEGGACVDFGSNIRYDSADRQKLG